MTKEATLKCKDVSEGLFSDERSISLDCYNGEEVTLFVPSDKILENSVHIKAEEKGAYSWATIPTEQPTVIPVLTSLVNFLD